MILRKIKSEDVRTQTGDKFCGGGLAKTVVEQYKGGTNRYEGGWARPEMIQAAKARLFFVYVRSTCSHRDDAVFPIHRSSLDGVLPTDTVSSDNSRMLP